MGSMVKVIADSEADDLLKRFPPELAHILHVLASVLVQATDADTEALFVVLCNFAAGVAATHTDAQSLETARRSLANNNGDVEAMIFRLCHSIPQANRELQAAMQPAVGNVH